MEPEIDRRCPDCGAAVRPQAAFCPQCGRATKAAAGGADAVDAEAPPEDKGFEMPKAGRPSGGGDKSARPLSVTLHPQSDPSSSAKASTAPAESISHPAQVARDQLASGKPPAADSTAHGARRRGQRVAAVARDVVEERLAPRVEKLRQASNVVWGEAQDDPNLRFILVALFLFIVAIVIILLGTYIR